jgi:hypothetical protein
LFYYLFPSELHWVAPTMNIYFLIVGVGYLLSLIQLIILLKLLWSFKKIEPSKKTTWTFVLVLFNSIAAPLFIWIELDRLIKSNEEIQSKNE